MCVVCIQVFDGTHAHTYTQHSLQEKLWGVWGMVVGKKLQLGIADVENREKENKCANKQDSKGKKE